METVKKLDAINYFGNATNLAVALGLTKGAISQWKETVPPLRAFQIKKLMEEQNKSSSERRTDTCV